MADEEPPDGGKHPWIGSRKLLPPPEPRIDDDDDVEPARPEEYLAKPLKDFDQARATFYLVAIIIGSNLFYVFWLLAVCTYLRIEMFWQGFPDAQPCGGIKDDIKEWIFEMLSIGLALMGGAAAGRASNRRGRE